MAKVKQIRSFSLDLTDSEAKALMELLQTEKWPTYSDARALLNGIWNALYDAHLEDAPTKGGN